MASETVRLRIRSVANAVLVSGQAYQEPKDALNEFVSNAADEYAQTGTRGGRITIVLRRRGRRPVITIADHGRGMSAARLREVAQGLFSSDKAGDRRTLGEKAIGILAFQQLGGACDIVSRGDGEAASARLTLERGRATARLEPNERRRARQTPGTTVYLYDLSRAVDERSDLGAHRLREPSAVRRIFDRVLRELQDLENPMRTTIATGTEEGLEPAGRPARTSTPPSDEGFPEADPGSPPGERPPPEGRPPPGSGPPRFRALPEIAPDPRG